MMIFSLTAQVPGGTQQQGNAEEVTDAEIENFAESFGEVQQIQQQHQQKMQEAVEESGLSVQEYQQIAQATSNPNSDAEVSQEEQRKYEAASQQVQSVQENMQSAVEEKLDEHDLDMNRFQQIYMQMRQDEELQEKVQEKMGTGQPPADGR